jgi:hypothetical protein
MFKSNKKKAREAAIYAQIAEEKKSDIKDDALWMKAVAKVGNDKDRTESEYIKLRFSKLDSIKTGENVKTKTERQKTLKNKTVIILIVVMFSVFVIQEVRHSMQEKEDYKILQQQKWNESRVSVVFKKGSTEIEKNYKFSDLKFKDAGQSYWNGTTRIYTSSKFIQATFMVNYVGTSTISSSKAFNLSGLYLKDVEGNSFGGVDPFLEPSWTRISTCKSLPRLKELIEYGDEVVGLKLASNVPCEFNALFEVAPDTVPDFVNLYFNIGFKRDGY